MRAGSEAPPTTAGPGAAMRALAVVSVLLLLLRGAPPSEASEGGRSARSAFLLSLLLPGLGQIYAGDPAGAKAFLGLEAAMWSAISAFSIYEGWLRDGYRNFAAVHSGADTRDKGEGFLKDIGLYRSIYEHNMMARWADGPEAQVYPEVSGWIWEWDSERSMSKYRKLRRESRSAHRRALFIGFAVVINHFISAVHASRLASGSHDGGKATLHVKPMGGTGLILNVRLRI